MRPPPPSAYRKSGWESFSSIFYCKRGFFRKKYNFVQKIFPPFSFQSDIQPRRFLSFFLFFFFQLLFPIFPSPLPTDRFLANVHLYFLNARSFRPFLSTFQTPLLLSPPSSLPTPLFLLAPVLTFSSFFSPPCYVPRSSNQSACSSRSRTFRLTSDGEGTVR